MKGIEATKEMMNGVARFYVKKPIQLRALQIDQTFWVASLEGNHQGKEGDYLIEGVKGELYICDKEIFEQSYELSNPSVINTSYICFNQERYLCIERKCQHAVMHDKEICDLYSMFPMRCRHCIPLDTLTCCQSTTKEDQQKGETR